MKRDIKKEMAEIMDDIKGRCDCLSDYESAGLQHGWENLINSRLDKWIEVRRETYEKKAKRR